MSRRPAIVTEADVRRTIRAARKEGLVIVRLVNRPDGVAVETIECLDVQPISVEHQPLAKEIKL